MNEPGPVTFGLLGAAVAVAGPILGPWLVVVLSAGIGALLALTVKPKEDDKPRAKAFGYILTGALVAMVLVGPVLAIVKTLYKDVPIEAVIVVVSFIIGARRDSVLMLLDRILEAVGTAWGSFLNALAARKGDGK